MPVFIILPFGSTPIYRWDKLSYGLILITIQVWLMPVFIILPFVSTPIYRWDTAYYPFTLWLYNYTIYILCLSGWQISGDGRRVGGGRSDKHRFLIAYDSNKKLYLVRFFDIVVGERPSCSCSVGRYSYPVGRCPCWGRPLLCCSSWEDS